jgi:wyosine [tRNA(Phe)-imidazoG37] synthetase (radical SAM superfamily)
MNVSPATELFRNHPHTYEDNRFVYVVVSRRSGGVSIGINLNPEKACNFDCVYCQVDRTVRGRPAMRKSELPQLAEELHEMVRLVTSGELFQYPQFINTPQPLRRLNDIALSGDGEPTASPQFQAVIDICVAARLQSKLEEVKIVIISNATMFRRPNVKAALAMLDQNNGEIWGKLDAGTEAYYREIDRSDVPLADVIENLVDVSTLRPIVIQTLFMRLSGVGPSAEELQAYCGQLQTIVARGGQIKLVQIHTVARAPAESFVTALDDGEVDAIVEFVRQETGLPAVAYYSG